MYLLGFLVLWGLTCDSSFCLDHMGLNADTCSLLLRGPSIQGAFSRVSVRGRSAGEPGPGRGSGGPSSAQTQAVLPLVLSNYVEGRRWSYGYPVTLVGELFSFTFLVGEVPLSGAMGWEWEP